jgi:hypothetical protein
MLSKYISLPTLIISFIIGLITVYMFGPEQKTIYIYPTPDNYTKNLYKDKANQCFEFKPMHVNCPLLPKSIPVQN